MRRKLEDWEQAEGLSTSYTRSQVDQFSPQSKAILELQTSKDIQILEVIYASSAPLGSSDPCGWSLKYATEFHMTNDSKLFPPKTKWEEQGFKPDEYSRWLRGEWRPIAEMISSLNPINAPIEKRLDDSESLDVGGITVSNTWVQCAQPPYNKLPVPRADLPPGIIISREGDEWISEDAIQAIALPLYEGRMVGRHEISQKGWVSGKGRSAVWRVTDKANSPVEPQFLMASDTYAEEHDFHATGKVGYVDVTSATNTRTMACAVLTDYPCGNRVNILRPSNPFDSLALAAVLNSLAYDWVARQRLTGIIINYFIAAETPLPIFRGAQGILQAIASRASRLTCLSPSTSPVAMQFQSAGMPRRAHLPAERLRVTIEIDALVACAYGLSVEDLRWILRDCDIPCDSLRSTSQSLDSKGFWRVDKDKDPELRHTVLTLIAFHNLEQKIREHGGDREAGIEAFLTQNNGEGWLLPETVRLADYGLGHDERALAHQPVASRLGPRFYDWQLAQSAEESWRECHLHARNLLGEAGYQNLLAEIEAERTGQKSVASTPPISEAPARDDQQLQLFS